MSFGRSPLVLVGIGALALLSVPFLLVGAGLLLGPVDSTADRWKNGVEFIVFMNPGASESEIDAVRLAIEASAEIDRFGFVTQREALVEFRAQFEDSDSIRASVGAADMPSSFRIVPANDESEAVRDLADSFRDDAGVFEVVTAADVSEPLDRIKDGTRNRFLRVGVILLASALLGAMAAIARLQQGYRDPA